ncbi:preprotein translocase subunit SecY [Limihaloglobus sulfuriphilus]|uniref:Protein translocase subunit SecY n=1 Tax=Limihaloglobus sulfuriphilus TaxID=1851148 RepID=A0A1Q2MIB1_9BACT|nr:preprotein translocase subunit SecY [Limihaloglobus sulfuriphilus]AQQ72037.1 preprotein translocase subunit SecY [Limihaloglobus sulfuriphilus]
MFQALVNTFKVPELRNKILFTVFLLCIYRIGFHIPVAGVDQGKLQAMSQNTDSSSPFQRMADTMSMFTGGTLNQSSLFGLGIMPYISASIILMLLGEVWPYLKNLKQEGMAGHKKIQEFTRYLTVPLCLFQAFVIMNFTAKSEAIYPEMRMQAFVFGIVGMTVGTLFLMWLGEQIDEYGIGNGISLLIMAGILSRMPWAVTQVINRATFQFGAQSDEYGPLKIGFLLFGFIFVIAGTILITQGQRRIPIQQAKMMRGRRMYGGMRHYVPLRVNQGGVMPIIFASSFMLFPTFIFSWMGRIQSIEGFAAFLNDAFRPNRFTYNFIFIVCIFLFAFFWTAIQFQPKDMAKRLRDAGSFIPGMRPGNRTADYLENVMVRITFYGAAFLAVIAVVPQAISAFIGIEPNVASFLGGTGLLIVVSVSLDLVQRIESQLIMRNYQGFSAKGRIKGSR